MVAVLSDRGARFDDLEFCPRMLSPNSVPAA